MACAVGKQKGLTVPITPFFVIRIMHNANYLFHLLKIYSYEKGFGSPWLRKWNNNSSQIWYKVQMHKVSLNGSTSCCSWRCLHVVVTLVSNYPFKAEESPIPSVSFMVGKKSASTGWSRHDGYIYNFEHIYNGWGLKKTYNMQVFDISMKRYENDLSFNAYQATKKDRLEGKRSRNLLKLT